MKPPVHCFPSAARLVLCGCASTNDSLASLRLPRLGSPKITVKSEPISPALLSLWILVKCASIFNHFSRTSQLAIPFTVRLLSHVPCRRYHLSSSSLVGCKACDTVLLQKDCRSDHNFSPESRPMYQFAWYGSLTRKFEEAGFRVSCMIGELISN